MNASHHIPPESATHAARDLRVLWHHRRNRGRPRKARFITEGIERATCG